MNRGRDSSAAINEIGASETVNRHNWRMSKQTTKLYIISDSLTDLISLIASSDTRSS